MPKFLTRGLSAILMLSLIFASLILPASAASSFSYRFNENPQMTSELRELALKHEMVPSEHTEVLVPIYYDYRYDWVDGCSWEQIRDMATETHSDYKYLVVKKTKGLVFYMTIWYEDVYFAENVLTGTRKFAAERLLDMKEGYKYNGEI